MLFWWRVRTRAAVDVFPHLASSGIAAAHTQGAAGPARIGQESVETMRILMSVASLETNLIEVGIAGVPRSRKFTVQSGPLLPHSIERNDISPDHSTFQEAGRTLTTVLRDGSIP